MVYLLRMVEFENNAYFWQKLDAIYLSGDFKTIYKKGSHHPKYHELIFPCDYGHIETMAGDVQQTLKVLKGEGNNVDALVVAANVIDKYVDVIAIVGVDNEEEITNVLEFLNNDDTQKTVIIRRGKNVPEWAVTE